MLKCLIRRTTFWLFPFFIMRRQNWYGLMDHISLSAVGIFGTLAKPITQPFMYPRRCTHWTVPSFFCVMTVWNFINEIWFMLIFKWVFSKNFFGIFFTFSTWFDIVSSKYSALLRENAFGLKIFPSKVFSFCNGAAA